MYLLTPALQSYDWGSIDAIPSLLGLEPTGQPVAEAWWGAHPTSPAIAATDGGLLPLTDVIAADAVGALGEDVARRWGGTLPYLVKILAIARPLSIQVHPSARQAREGFDTERRATTPGTPSVMAFKDRSDKPEMVIALTPMVILAGFRPVADLVLDLGAIGTEHTQALCDTLTQGRDESAGIAAYVRAVLNHPRDVTTIAALVKAAHVPGASRSLQVAAGAVRHYGDDPGVLVALALTTVDLEPGEALFTDAGVVHSYQSGTGLEVMANSDNVVRAGLTSKPVDVDLFLGLATTTPQEAPHVHPTVAGGARTFASPTGHFDVTLLSHDAVAVSSGPRIVLAIAGTATVTTRDASLSLAPGRAAFVADRDAKATVQAEDLVAVVSVPPERGK